MALAAAKIQKIYGMGARLGMVDSSNKGDALHTLVAGITGKEHISQLTDDEYKAVVGELAVRLKISQLEPPPQRKQSRRYESLPGKITEGQQKKIWFLMYKLAACDSVAVSASLGERLAGIVKRQFNIDATEKQPMKWLSYEQGHKLIEIVNKYVESAERKAMAR